MEMTIGELTVGHFELRDRITAVEDRQDVAEEHIDEHRCVMQEIRGDLKTILVALLTVGCALTVGLLGLIGAAIFRQ